MLIGAFWAVIFLKGQKKQTETTEQNTKNNNISPDQLESKQHQNV
jgi:predicted amino acid dehydrogenase